MAESNYDILGVPIGASEKEIRSAFRRLVLDHHSDRGGDEEKIKKIIQAYEDLKQGKAYPDTDDEKLKKSKVYSGDSEEERRKRNTILSLDVAREMKLAEDWTSLLKRNNAVGSRLFGSKELGESEFEVKESGDLFIKGKFWAGQFTYDGSIMLSGSITSPYFAKDENVKTVIRVLNGNFTIRDPLPNNYTIENGAKIIAENGDIVVGNLVGVREIMQDPQGRIGVYTTREHFTELRAPRGKIVAGTARETVLLEAQTVVVNNMINNVKVRAKDISVFGSTVNYNCEIEMLQEGSLVFHDEGSGYALSDDVLIKLENGKWFTLNQLKTSNLVGFGKKITYEHLDVFGGRQEKPSGRKFKIGGFKDLKKKWSDWK